MPSRMVFTATEREKLGVLVNNLSIFAAQIVSQGAPGLSTRALSNLATVKREHEELLKRLDELAREHGDESPLRLIEDLASVPGDVAQMLTIVRRCLLVSGFLGHCMARASHPEVGSASLSEGRRLH